MRGVFSYIYQMKGDDMTRRERQRMHRVSALNYFMGYVSTALFTFVCGYVYGGYVSCL